MAETQEECKPILGKTTKLTKLEEEEKKIKVNRESWSDFEEQEESKDQLRMKSLPQLKEE